MKGALPQVRVIGAKPTLDALGSHERYRGKHLWQMPAPTSYAEHTKKRKHKKTGDRIEVPVLVPIYRGVSAQEMRYARSQQKRAVRKQREAREAKVEKIGSAGDFLKTVLEGQDDDKEEGLD